MFVRPGTGQIRIGTRARVVGCQTGAAMTLRIRWWQWPGRYWFQPARFLLQQRCEQPAQKKRCWLVCTFTFSLDSICLIDISFVQQNHFSPPEFLALNDSRHKKIQSLKHLAHIQTIKHVSEAECPQQNHKWRQLKTALPSIFGVWRDTAHSGEHTVIPHKFGLVET